MPDPHVPIRPSRALSGPAFPYHFPAGQWSQAQGQRVHVQALALTPSLWKWALGDSPGMEPRRRLWSLAGGVGCRGGEAGLAEVEVARDGLCLCSCWTQPPQGLTEKRLLQASLPRLPLCDRWPVFLPWRLVWHRRGWALCPVCVLCSTGPALLRGQ